jgi:Co/Zn/Cd efflux system component
MNNLRTTVAIVAAANLGYFALEFLVALDIESVSLLADSVDFLEDAAVNILIFIALAWPARRRARVGMILAGLLLLPALALLWALWGKWTAPSVPAPFALSLTGLGALVVNVSCALLLARFRDRAGSLTKAAYLSARNDALANFAIIAAGLTTLLHPSIWPDVIVGLGIAILNADAAREVWEAARNERGAGDQRA